MTRKVKLNLPKAVTKQLPQGVNVVAMTREVMTGTQPLLDALQAKNENLSDKIAALAAAKTAYLEAAADLRGASADQRTAYGDVAGLVQTASDGDESYIVSCGFGVRAEPRPLPPIESAPDGLITLINGTPGRIILSWQGVEGARNYAVEYTADLTGATGWTAAAEMTGKQRLNIDGLTRGTKYLFRVRACGIGAPGPWSATIEQMAP